MHRPEPPRTPLPLAVAVRGWLADPSGVPPEPLPRFGVLARIAIGLAMTWVLCAGAYQALTAGPYHVRDEQAHVGYAMSLSSGRMPTIETPIAVPPTSPAMVERLNDTGYEGSALIGYQKVWVANHPPGAYLPALPGVWLGRALGSGNIVLFSLRMTNVAGFALSVMAAAFLTREVTRSVAPAVVAATATAASPYLQNATAWAMTDGMTLAVTTGVVWAAVRALRRHFDANATIVVAVLAAACGLTRLTAVATAAVAAATALVIHAWRSRRFVWRPAAAIAGAVALTSGWFWVGNLLRYGDLAASNDLYEWFGRAPRGTLLETMSDSALWRQLIATVLEHNIDWAPEWHGTLTPVTVTVLALAGVGLLALADRGLARRAPSAVVGRHGTAEGPVGDVDWAAPVVLGASWLAAALLLANHVKSGGNPFGRYVLVWIPIAACLVGAVLLVFRRRIVAATATAAFIGAYVHHSHMALARFHSTLEVRFLAPPNSPQRRPVGPAWSQDLMFGATRLLAVFVVIAATAAVFATFANRPTAPDGPTASRSPEDPEHRDPQVVR